MLLLRMVIGVWRNGLHISYTWLWKEVPTWPITSAGNCWEGDICDSIFPYPKRLEWIASTRFPGWKSLRRRWIYPRRLPGWVYSFNKCLALPIGARTLIIFA